jgi:hypothetical protein
MKQFSFLIFIDGLDEFDGNSQDLVTLILDLQKISPRSFKACVASRPWLIFEESFRTMPWLRMEDLTRPDIRFYIEDNMQQSSRWNDLQKFMPAEASKMIEEITEKAVGVFLWVTLVVASLIGGLRDGDDVEDLWQRINELPSALEELFQKILGDLNPRYFAQGCEMFQLAFTAFDPLTLLDMSFALEGPKAAIQAPLGQLDKEELLFRGDTMRRRVISRSKGLLEVPSASVMNERAKVEYLHRTVRDFFKSEASWKYIRSGAPDFDAPLMLSASFLRQVKTTKVRNTASTLDEFWRSFTSSVEYMRLYEDADKSTMSIEILDALARSGDDYWGQSPLHPGYENWLEELVDGCTTRDTRPEWTCIASQYPFKNTTDTTQQNQGTASMWTNGAYSKRQRDMPHWSNTIHLADLSPIHPAHSIQLETRRVPLRSFVEFAFIIKLNFYIVAKANTWISCPRTIGDRPILLRAISDHNYPIAHLLLELGSDPNFKLSSKNATPWELVLRRTRECQDVNEVFQLRRLAVAFVEHGADLGIVILDDLNSVFVDMGTKEKDALICRVHALKETRRPGGKKDDDSSTFSIRKRIREKFRVSSSR